MDGEWSLSLASSDSSELSPPSGISRMTGKQGGGLEDKVVVPVDRCFFFGRESSVVVDFILGRDASPSGSRVVV